MFGRATITLGIGPHSSLWIYLNNITTPCIAKVCVPWNLPLSRIEKMRITLQHSCSTATIPVRKNDFIVCRRHVTHTPSNLGRCWTYTKITVIIMHWVMAPGLRHRVFQDAGVLKVDRRIIIITRMWANAQRDGRPDEHRWHPLFNAAKFGWRPLLDAVQ